jgi:signal transduction histidine kinase/ligand-binding sensor domain-containing protein
MARALIRRQAAILLAVLLFTVVLIGTAVAQTPLAPSRDRILSELHHTSWTAKDGVPAEVSALAQTNDGYLWLGTANGLWRFDGARFERYEPPEGQKFPAYIIESLLATPDGGLFIGFRNAGASFLIEGRVTIYDESDGMPPGTVREFARARDGSIWAATTQGLLRLEGSRWQKIGRDWNYPWPSAQAVFVDRDGALWVAGKDAIVFLPEGQTQFQRTAEQVVDRVFEVNSIVQAPDGKMWMGETSQSVRPIRIRPSDTTGPSLPEVIVGSYRLLFDDAGSLWIASLGDGVGRIRFTERLSDLGAQQFQAAAEVFAEKDGLSSNFVLPVLEDREGNIWVGTGAGLDRFQESNAIPTALPPGSNDMILIPGDHGDLWTGSLNRRLTHIEGRSVAVQKQEEEWGSTSGYRDNDGTLWLGGPTGIAHIVKGQFLKIPLPADVQNTWIVALNKGVGGDIWASITSSGVYRLTQGVWTKFGSNQGLPEGFPNNIFTDSQGRVWFGYIRGQLALFDGNSFRALTKEEGIEVGAVKTIYEHGTHLWIGGEFGLKLYEQGRFRKVNAADPTKFRGISGIVEMENGDLWLNTADGITYVQASEVRQALDNPDYSMLSRGFDYLDGLPGTSAQLRARPTVVRGTDGRLWFSLANGVVWIDPDRMRKNLLPPPVYVSSVSANDKEYTDLTNLKLPLRTTSVQIAYTALSLTTPERVRFRYRLEGADPDWQDVGARRTAFYTNLGPGNYRFLVMACNNDGIWNEVGATLDFTIAPAWNQTNWFRTVCVVFALFVIWALYRLRLRQVARAISVRFDERLAERTRIARELHDTLLQTVQGSKLVADDALEKSNDSAHMRHAMKQLSGWLEQATQEGRAALNSLRTSTIEMNDLAAGLRRATEECLLNSNMAVKFSVAGGPRDMHPIARDEIYRIGYEAIRNACEHASASKLEVSLNYAQNLTLRVIDNGIGIEAAVLTEGKEGHFGLQGMRERAERIGSKLTLFSSPKSGTEMTLVVPGGIIFRKASPTRFERIKTFLGRGV